jgi:MinD-like ATPase involved in chromosome partitioning or flagellar assembly
MALFVLAAAKGAPGVSTAALALALVWPGATGGRRVLLADADVAGGAAVSSFQRLGLGDGRGLLGWAAAAPGPDRLEQQLLALDPSGRRLLLAGLPDAAGAAALSGRWPQLLDDLVRCQAEDDLDVLVDMGRFGSRHEALALVAGADAVLLVLRSTFSSVSFSGGLLASLATACGERTGAVRALLVGERDPYTAGEVAKDLQVPVLAALPRDDRSARALDGGRLEQVMRSRSTLLRGAQHAAAALLAQTLERTGA